MSAFHITIETDNAAFHGNDARDVELRRILEHVRETIRWHGSAHYIGGRALLDGNGNTVGDARFYEEPLDTLTWQEREKYPTHGSIRTHLVDDHGQPDDAELAGMTYTSLMAVHREQGRGEVHQ